MNKIIIILLSLLISTFVWADENVKSMKNLALNYGGRAEILRATNSIVQKALNKEIRIEQIDEELFKKHLYTYGQNDPDLIIRTAGEKRLSNFFSYTFNSRIIVFTL